MLARQIVRQFFNFMKKWYHPVEVEDKQEKADSRQGEDENKRTVFGLRVQED